MRTRVLERDEVLETSSAREDVTVERVPIGRAIDTVPAVRAEGEVLIVPVIEERAVVTVWSSILKEEIWITRRSNSRNHSPAGASKSQRMPRSFGLHEPEARTGLQQEED